MVKKHPLVFIPEGITTLKFVEDREDYDKHYRNVLPNCLHTLDSPWSFCAVDRRTSIFNKNQLGELTHEFFQICGEVQRFFKKENTKDSSELITTINAPIEYQSTDNIPASLKNRMLTFCKFFINLSLEYEKKAREAKNKLIQSGYFPVSICGAIHSYNLDCTYAIVSGEDSVEFFNDIFRQSQYIESYLRNNEHEKPTSIPRNFRKYQIYKYANSLFEREE